MPRQTDDSNKSLNSLGNASFKNLDDADPIENELRARFEFTSRDFSDRGNEYQHEHEYERSRNEQGLVLLFNQEKFDDTNFKPREGSVRDLNNLINTFKKLGFNVRKENIFIDLDRGQIFDKLSNLKEEDCKNANSLIVVFMTHGNTHNVLYAKTGQLTVNELIDPLAKRFEDKPKLFIIQACKATEMDNNSETTLTFPIYTLPSDCVIYFSTVEGKVSIRHMIRGTWLIEELCRNFLMYGRKEDILSLLQRTTKCISILESEAQGKPYKQMPVTVSTLQKKFYLADNKYRRNIHFATEGIVNVSGKLEELLQEYIHSVKDKV